MDAMDFAESQKMSLSWAPVWDAECFGIHSESQGFEMLLGVRGNRRTWVEVELQYGVQHFRNSKRIKRFWIVNGCEIFAESQNIILSWASVWCAKYKAIHRKIWIWCVNGRMGFCGIVENELKLSLSMECKELQRKITDLMCQCVIMYIDELCAETNNKRNKQPRKHQQHKQSNKHRHNYTHPTKHTSIQAHQHTNKHKHKHTSKRIYTHKQTSKRTLINTTHTHTQTNTHTHTTK